MLGVVGGHVMGCWCRGRGPRPSAIDDHIYHYVAVGGGLVAGVLALVGMVILIYRRRTVGPVFSATTRMDKAMYAFLGAVIVLGMWNTIAGSIFSSAASTTTARACRSGTARSWPSSRMPS